MKQKMKGLMLAAVLASGMLSGCGSGTEQASAGADDAYQEIELVMAVNGTDIQIDTMVAKSPAAELPLRYFQTISSQGGILPRESR